MHANGAAAATVFGVVTVQVSKVVVDLVHEVRGNAPDTSPRGKWVQKDVAYEDRTVPTRAEVERKMRIGDIVMNHSWGEVCSCTFTVWQLCVCCCTRLVQEAHRTSVS